jgi:hypothetical protein
MTEEKQKIETEPKQEVKLKPRREDKEHDFFIAQFQEDWTQYRHIENERWRLFTYYFVLNTALLTIIATASLENKLAQAYLPQIVASIGFMSATWTTFFAIANVKLRREFILHTSDMNMIRRDVFNICHSTKGEKQRKRTIWAPPPEPEKGNPQQIKFDSIYMVTNYLTFVFSATVSGLCTYLYTNEALPATAMAYFIMTLNFELLFVESYSARETESKMTLNIFSKESEQKLKWSWFFFSMMEVGYLGLIFFGNTLFGLPNLSPESLCFLNLLLVIKLLLVLRVFMVWRRSSKNK